MAYLIDTNVYIYSKNIPYPFNCFPGFWDWIDLGIKSKNFILLQEVYDEIVCNNDDLANWLKLRKEFVVKMSPQAMLELKGITNRLYADEKRYKKGTVPFFLNGADPYLIAYAKAHNLTVVSQEKLQLDCKSPKIPVICSYENVKCCTLPDLIKKLNPRFVLEQIKDSDLLFSPKS